MKPFQFRSRAAAGCCALFLTLFMFSPKVRANVYATDIYVNGNLTNATGAVGTALTVSYRLNESDVTNVTVSFLQGGVVKATVVGGTNRGLNTVSWTPTSTGIYTVNIKAAAAGFKLWTQISADTNAGNYAFYPAGMAVDNNTNSPYYGRVLLGCASAGVVGTNHYYDGIYKLNADGSYADEGGFGYGGYVTDDSDNTSVGEMPPNSGFVPWLLRVGAEDRIYMEDYSQYGAIVSFDMLMKTNLVVIDDGGLPNNYSGNPYFGDLSTGVTSFDVTGGGTTNAAVWLGDGDNPGWGVWMYYMVNGASDPNDNLGVQAVEAGAGDLSLNAGGGLMVDNKLDIFVAQYQLNPSTAYVQMKFPSWNGGVLPLESLDTNSFYAETNATGTGTGEVVWGDGAGDATDTGCSDTVIDSRAQPKYVATPFDNPYGAVWNGGIRVLHAANGSVVTATNGATVQSLTNLDFANGYTCAAWDNVGNLYAASNTTNRWRAWSPPGGNTNTTVAVALLTISGAVGPPIPFTITRITTTATTPGSRTVTITFTAPSSLTASDFTLLGSTNINGTYTTVSGATITGGSGSYQAVATTPGAIEFFKIEE